VYTRSVEGKEIELGVSGKLYKDALVMFDRETGTLWTQVDGSALRGPLSGHRLVELPAMQTTWKVWKSLHPDTLVLRKPASVRASPYADYFTDPNRRGLSGTRGDKRLEGKALIVGLSAGDDAVAVPLSALEKRQVVEVQLSGDPVVVFYPLEEQTAAAFRARVSGRRLTFRVRRQAKHYIFEDVESGSQWSPLDGHAIAGPLKGARLDPVPYLQSYWYAWAAYRPQTRIVP
jgi:hypothetical protein